MQYIAQDGDTFASVAAQYTIGGTAYGDGLEIENAGVALANAVPSNMMVTGAIYLIPDAWLKPVWVGVDQFGKPLPKPLTISIGGAGLTTGQFSWKIPALLLTLAVLVSLYGEKK